MSHPMCEGVGLARPGAGNDEQGPSRGTGVISQAMLHGRALLWVQLVEIGQRHRDGGAGG